MDKYKLHRLFTDFLNKNFDPKRAEKEKAYLYSSLGHYGVDSGKRSEFFNKHKNHISNLTKSQAIVYTKYFWKKPSFEEKMFSLYILQLHSDKLGASDVVLVENLMRECGGWALLDHLIIPLMPVILDKEESTYSYLKKWIKDDDFWVRRSALLAQLLFFRKGSGGEGGIIF